MVSPGLRARPGPEVILSHAAGHADALPGIRKELAMMDRVILWVLLIVVDLIVGTLGLVVLDGAEEVFESVAGTMLLCFALMGARYCLLNPPWRQT
jgi:hypothetical protein